MQETEDMGAPFRGAASKVASTSKKPVEVAADWIGTLKNAIKTSRPSMQNLKAKVISGNLESNNQSIV